MYFRVSESVFFDCRESFFCPVRRIISPHEIKKSIPRDGFFRLVEGIYPSHEMNSPVFYPEYFFVYAIWYVLYIK